MSSSGLTLADSDFEIKNSGTGAPATVMLLSSLDGDPSVEAFFEGTHSVYEGAQESYSSQKIIIREKQGSTADTSKGAFVASNWLINNDSEASNTLAANLELLGLEKMHRPMIIKEGTSCYWRVRLERSRLGRTQFQSKLMVLGTRKVHGQLTFTGASGDGYAKIIEELMTPDGSGNYPSLAGFSFTFFDAAGDVLYKTSSVDASGDATTTRWSSSDTRLVGVGSPTATNVQACL